ncbi:MAG: RNA polymerase sigma factor [Planctomycetota bacterium]
MRSTNAGHLPVCRSRGLQDADAQDVTQEVLAAILQRVGEWQPGSDRGSFRGWVLRIARNRSVDAIARRTGRLCGSGDTQVLRSLAEVPGDDGAEAFELEYTRALFGVAAETVRQEVSERTWSAFALTALEGASAADAARRLGISVGAVYTARCRTVARIRECTQRLEGQGPGFLHNPNLRKQEPES